MSERNKTQGRQTSRIYSPCILADHHPVSWLLSPPRRSVPIAVLPLGLVQAAASHAATHEQVNHASRGHKPRAIRGETQRHENGRRARRGRRTVGEASSAHGRLLCVIGHINEQSEFLRKSAMRPIASRRCANKRIAAGTSKTGGIDHTLI